MPIERVVIRNYRAIRHADVKFVEGINIIVGDNEAGKSTLLEAINLALRRQLNRRPADYELHPYLINIEETAKFVAAHGAGKPIAPPEVKIELYLKATPETEILRGSINSEKIDTPGISLTIKLDDNLKSEYQAYVANKLAVRDVPIDYYEIVWRSFGNAELTARAIPIKSTLIDPSNISNSYAANKFVLESVRDHLTVAQRADLAVAYRMMRDKFQNDERVTAINKDLSSKTGIVSDKVLSMAMDTTTRASWETGVLPHLNDIPLTLVGKGEQNTVKIKLAIEAAERCDVFLMEEPENHLSHTNLGKLVGHLAKKCNGKQLIISTHSSFVLNKLGIENVMMFNGKDGVTLDHLPAETKSYFRRLPGHDTLRMILAKRSILVEGPSDELIVQRGFRQKHGKLPLEAGVEVISVGTSFKRFLDIAKLLHLDVSVVRDNDGKPNEKKALFKDYEGAKHIHIHIDSDADAHTLEPQLIKANGLAKINKMLGEDFKTELELAEYMKDNKTDCALILYEHPDELAIPEYILNAIR